MSKKNKKLYELTNKILTHFKTLEILCKLYFGATGQNTEGRTDGQGDLCKQLHCKTA